MRRSVVVGAAEDVMLHVEELARSLAFPNAGSLTLRRGTRDIRLVLLLPLPWKAGKTP